MTYCGHCVCISGADGQGAALLDTLFWAIVLAALFEFGLIAAAGQPRGFVLLTAAGGMGLYFAALSETMLEAIMRLLQVLAKS